MFNKKKKTRERKLGLLLTSSSIFSDVKMSQLFKKFALDVI